MTKPSVLVVDDEPIIRENLQAYLEDEGMQVVSAASAEKALACVEDGDCFEVCIMNIRLPAMNGHAAIRALHTLCPEMEFIIHTGSVNYTLPKELCALGLKAEQVYLKPIGDMAPLAAMILRLVVRRRRSAER